MPRTLTVFAETFPLHAPFRISRGVKTAAEVVTVTIGQDGMTGRGEGVPYPRYGESIASAIAAIETMRGMIEQGLDRQELLESMPASAARNAVDCALWDLELQLTGSDLATALGLERPLHPIVTAMTISLDTPDNMARCRRRARRCAAAQGQGRPERSCHPARRRSRRRAQPANDRRSQRKLDDR